MKRRVLQDLGFLQFLLRVQSLSVDYPEGPGIYSWLDLEVLLVVYEGSSSASERFPNHA